VPLITGASASLLIVALSLGSYWLHYFPYEDDFSLIRYSAAQNSPAPLTWISEGFSKYFANDPDCVTGSFGMVRPVANATQYLESLFHSSASGPQLMFTNVLCWILSSCLVYGIVRRLGASQWMAAAGILLYAISPCWYRVLIHSSFRNNGIATGCLLAAFYLMLKSDGLQSYKRLLVAGGFLALAAGSHEQALTSIPILVLSIAWLGYRAEKAWRFRQTAIAALLVLAPSLLTVACFRLMNHTYGVSYASTGFLESLSHSDRLAALGIHSLPLVAIIKTAQRILGALLGTLDAFTPFGADNMARPNTYIGMIIFVLAAGSLVAGGKGSVALGGKGSVTPGGKEASGLFLAALIFLLYAFGRNIAMPSADPRFTQMEVAWGVILLMCALSAGVAARNWRAIVPAALAAVALLGFEAVSFEDTIIARHSMLILREEVDREAFHGIQAAAKEYPGARVILINDQAAMWSARAMLELAGFMDNDFEILPTIGNWPSTDVLRDFSECTVGASLLALPATVQIQFSYPLGCSVSTFGRDVDCTIKRYRLEHRPYATAWSECLRDNPSGCQPPLRHDVPMESGRSLVVVAWHQRLSAPDIRTFPDEADLSRDKEIIL
jgi:hypothetical protein